MEKRRHVCFCFVFVFFLQELAVLTKCRIYCCDSIQKKAFYTYIILKLVYSLKSALSTQVEMETWRASCCYGILNWACDLDILAGLSTPEG